MSAHLKAQALRFLRVSALAFAAGLLTTGGKIDAASLWAIVAGAGEAGLRQLVPVAPVPNVSADLAPTSAPPTDPVPPTAKG